MPKVVIEDIEGEVYAAVGTHMELTTVHVTLEIDLDRMGDVVRRAYHSRGGVASWADRGIRAIVQEEARP